MSYATQKNTLGLIGKLVTNEQQQIEQKVVLRGDSTRLDCHPSLLPFPHIRKDSLRKKELFIKLAFPLFFISFLYTILCVVCVPFLPELSILLP